MSDRPYDEALFRDRVPEAAARQLAAVLAYATECQLATLEMLELRKSASKSDLCRHRGITDTLVRHCRELGVSPRAGFGACPRLTALLPKASDEE